MNNFNKSSYKSNLSHLKNQKASKLVDLEMDKLIEIKKQIPVVLDSEEEYSEEEKSIKEFGEETFLFKIRYKQRDSYKPKTVDSWKKLEDVVPRSEERQELLYKFQNYLRQYPQTNQSIIDFLSNFQLFLF